MFQDLRFGVRTLVRSPGFSLTAAMTLALGIGVTSLMFSVVNAVLLRPLPYPDADRLMLLFSVNGSGAGNTIRLSALDFEDFRARARSFESMAGHVGTGFTFSGGGADPELVIGQMVTSDFFSVLGVHPALGRTFAKDELTPDAKANWCCRSGSGSDASVVIPPSSADR